MRAAYSVAIHEAGHVWAHRFHEVTLRYVTIQPRSRRNGKRIHGACRPWKPRRIDPYVQAFIAGAGPIAEAICLHKRRRHISGEDSDFYDYLATALLDGGAGDLEMAHGLLSGSPGIVEGIRQDLQRDWSGIEVLAGRLVAEGTVSGRDALRRLRTLCGLAGSDDRSG